MSTTMRCQIVLAALLSISCICFAQSVGEATYKAKCQSCHGATGTPNAGIAKLMGMKPASDPEIKKLTAAQEFESVKKGKGKMKPIVGLADNQIKDAISYFRTLK